jgi:hypothetical protein
MSAQLKISALRFIKLNAAGGKQSADAANWDSVEDTKTGLTWSLKETPRMNWKKAMTYSASLTLCGFNDWRLPTCDELLTLVDRSKYSPAIDTTYFPECKSDWYWTSTLAAYSPAGCAWIVLFDNGSAGWGSQDCVFRVRAVRASQ